MPDLAPEVKNLVETRAHAINQKIIDARMTRAPFPGEEIRRIINDSAADNSVGYLAYYLATLVDVALKNLFEAVAGN